MTKSRRMSVPARPLGGPSLQPPVRLNLGPPGGFNKMRLRSDNSALNLESPLERPAELFEDDAQKGDTFSIPVNPFYPVTKLEFGHPR